VGRPKLIKVDVTDGRGLGGAKNKTVNVQTRIPDILAFRGTPGFAYLLLAANPQVSIPVLRDVLEAVAQPHTDTWLYSRKQLFEKPVLPSVDARAVEYVRAHMKQRVRKSQSALRAMGIRCSLRDLYSIWAVIHYVYVTET
jgi:hypothetical protein